MMSKLSTHCSNQNKPFKPKIYQGKRREQGRNNYDQDRYQNWYRSNSEDRYSRPWYRDRPQYGPNYKEKFQYIQN